MIIIKHALVGIALLLMCACSQPVEIVGEGDIRSASGTRDCSLENSQTDTCKGSLALGKTSETYTATPRSGWQFRRWEPYCLDSLDNECSMTIPAPTLQSLMGATEPPLKAIFRPTTNTGFTSLFIGNDFAIPFTHRLQALAKVAGYTDHHTTAIYGDGDQGTPQALWENPSQRIEIQSVLDTGNIELFGMTYDAAHPESDGYKHWIDYALSKNPDTRFFISVPWNTQLRGVSNAEYKLGYDGIQAQVHELIDSLHSAYPGVDIYSIPTGESAVKLRKLFRARKLPDVTQLVGPPDKSVFQTPEKGPADILVALGELVWLNAIYNIDMADYNDQSPYQTNLKGLAQTITNGHSPKYNAPDDVDVDTDGDGIVDRLDTVPTGKLNILVIMVDDLGYNDLAINNNNTSIHTPNLDQLARDGVRFTRHYATSVCSPARAALLTGLYPERLGFLPSGPGISPEITTLPERLQDEGYTTWQIGKWHIGDLQRTAWPDHQGFDHWFGFLNQAYLGGVHRDGELGVGQPKYHAPWLVGDSEPGAVYPGHLEDILTKKAITVLSQLKAEKTPWFMYLAYFAPHAPIQPAADFASLYPDTGAGKYRALVHQLDHNIGRVISHLDDLGTLQDTIVVVVSDNGGTNQAIDSNAPFVGMKGFLTEGALRTPLIIHWPDAAMNKQVLSDIVAIEDIYPTLLEAAEVDVPTDIDGNSFYNSVKHRQRTHQKARFRDYRGSNYTALSADGRWRLQMAPSFYTPEISPTLYDFQLDPNGAQEVTPLPPAPVEHLSALYLDWYRDVHTIQTSLAATGTNGRGALTGMDFLRTPGEGAFTFGIGISNDLNGLIAQQIGVWQMRRSGTEITAAFGEISLSGAISQARDCHSIVVTGQFNRQTQLFAAPDKISLSLYIDGALAQTQASDTILMAPDPTVVTTIGDLGSPTGTLNPPVMLNMPLSDTSPLTVQAFSQELCHPT